MSLKKQDKEKSPITDLVAALLKDKEYMQVWICNISIAFQDEFRRSHKENGINNISNQAAKNFMKMLINKEK